MASHNITITANQTYDPTDYQVFPGDTVTFHNRFSEDAIMCIDDPRVYGGTRFYIPSLGRLTLVVQNMAGAIRPASPGAEKRIPCGLTYFVPQGANATKDEIRAELNGLCEPDPTAGDGVVVPGPIVNPPD